jgi:hypothetical protein
MEVECCFCNTKYHASPEMGGNCPKCGSTPNFDEVYYPEPSNKGKDYNPFDGLSDNLM